MGSVKRSMVAGALALALLLGLYFGVVALVSGWGLTLSQFERTWFDTLPAFGVVRAFTVFAKYQTQLFWVGLACGNAYYSVAGRRPRQSDGARTFAAFFLGCGALRPKRLFRPLRTNGEIDGAADYRAA